MRRGQKFLLFLGVMIILLGAGGYLYNEEILQHLKQQVNKWVKYKLEKELPCRISIGAVHPHWRYGVSLEDVKIGIPCGANCGFNVDIDQAFLKYNLWEALLFNRKKDIQKPAEDLIIFLGRGEISLTDTPYALKNLQGKLIFNQDGLTIQDMQGSLNGSAEQTITFSGQLNQEQCSGTFHFNHFKFDKFDILTNLVLTLNKTTDSYDQNPKIRATLKTYGTVINHQPFSELNASLEVKDTNLRVFSFSIGKGYDLRGIVNLNPPYNADLSLNFHQAEPNELIAQLFPAENFRQPDFSGVLNGLIKISGPLERPNIEGYLEAKQGRIGELDFLWANMNIKGRYPRVLISDSRICREEGSFIVEGEMDISEFKKENFNINIEPEKGIFWQGWDVTRKRANQVHVSKNIAEDFKVTFDSFMKNKTANPHDDEKSELALEYKIQGNQLLKLRLREEEEIVGIERRIRF